MEKILVIDDEKPTLTMFRFTLNAYGYSVLTAENGKEGIEVFQRERPFLVLTDVKMPGMDGIEVLRQIKKIEPKAEVIVITGHGDMELAIKALNLDATDFLNKPIQRQALEKAIRRARERIELSRSEESRISVREVGSSAVVHIQGNVSAQSEQALREICEGVFSSGTELLVLHFDPNVSINGAGISILTQIILDGQKRGCRISIAGLSDNFKRVIKIVGISNLVEIFDSVEAALADSTHSTRPGHRQAPN
jgi:anti-anti-sigma factor